MKLMYVGLEQYESRYTLQLTEWTKRVFDRRKVEYTIMTGKQIDDSKKIVTGQVLDAHGRSFFSLTQMAEVVKELQTGNWGKDDVIFFEDQFTPGFESLGYIIDQVDEKFRPRIFVRCLAQTIDPDDFVHVYGMEWMRYYEKMVNNIVSKSGGALLMSNEEMVMHAKVAGWDVPMYNISGLSFGKSEVQERAGNIPSFYSRPNRVVFASRFDQEKQPHFFMDLIEKLQDPSIQFTLISGTELRSNDSTAIHRARKMEQSGDLTIVENATKTEYYTVLKNSRVLFASSLQDWTSNVVSEADTLGTNVLFPAYRSFPEIFANDHTRLYVPWSLDDASAKLHTLLGSPSVNMGKISEWTDGTIDRMIDIMERNGEQFSRNSIDYRNHTRLPKYS